MANFYTIQARALKTFLQRTDYFDRRSIPIHHQGVFEIEEGRRVDFRNGGFSRLCRSRFRKVKAASIFVVSDLATKDFGWNPQFHSKELKIAFRNLLEVCVEALAR